MVSIQVLSILVLYLKFNCITRAGNNMVFRKVRDIVCKLEFRGP